MKHFNHRIIVRNSPPIVAMRYDRPTAVFATNVVKWLIGHANTDVNAKDDGGQTPLHYAISEGHDDVVELLIGHTDVDVNAKDRLGRTPLHCAILKGHDDVVKRLIDHANINVNTEDFSGRTPWDDAISGKCVDAAKLLLRHETFKPPHHRTRCSFDCSGEI
ncbi:MAG: ankyrin repeat domain-containing protein [Simkaniaceae bacterium]|nr:ankyrin repeat domain-containing protein [Simkaniaceae bacterium]